MSERMIELQRARLGLPPPAGISPAASMHAAARSPGKGNLQSPKATMMKQQTPEEVAVLEQQSEDAQIQRFIHRLQQRDEHHHSTLETRRGSTVPTALSRRMLQKQGVGYLDDTVASAVSASADRFLATILQQAVACRDQRLKGADMAREAARHRKRHMQHYEADTDNRKRRREQREETREKEYLEAIQIAESLKKGGASRNEEDKKKTKKKKPEDGDGTNESTSKNPMDQDDDDESYDSIDEEEEYYQEKLGDIPTPKEKNEEDEDEEEDVILLKDLIRPLEAWDFHIDGKEALETHEEESGGDGGDDDDEGEGDEEDIGENTSIAPTEDVDDDDDAASATGDTPKKERPPPKNGGATTAGTGDPDVPKAAKTSPQSKKS